VGVQDQQEDRLPNRNDGRGQGPDPNRPTIPADLLAHGPQGAQLDELAGLSDEHGRDLAQ